MSTRRRARIRLRLVLAAVALLALVAGGWLWLRDSPLVAVRTVSISGATGPDAAQIRSSLTLAARNMTTLDVRVGQLRTVVAPYPVVKDLRVSTSFPHAMRIQVIEQLPVGALEAGGRTVAASGDGTLLHDVPTGTLPAIPVVSLPAGSRVSDRAALEALALLSATPPRLLPRIAQVSTSPPHGLVVQIRSGPSIYFGDRTGLTAKWIAATEVLGDPSSAGASYIDVTDPSRPAAGVGQEAVVAAGLAPTGTATTTLGTSTPAPAGPTPPTAPNPATTTPSLTGSAPAPTQTSPTGG